MAGSISAWGSPAVMYCLEAMDAAKHPAISSKTPIRKIFPI